MSDLNYFKYITLIEAGSASSLTLKLQAINITYQLNKVWSDGKKHYALINAKRPLPKTVENKIDQIK